MRKGDVNMMHTKFPDVNNTLFLWRDQREILHATRRSAPGVTTLCGEFTSEMTYAGRAYDGCPEVPTCLACVTSP